MAILHHSAEGVLKVAINSAKIPRHTSSNRTLRRCNEVDTVLKTRGREFIDAIAYCHGHYRPLDWTIVAPG